jgi:hypothetical protein
LWRIIISFVSRTLEDHGLAGKFAVAKKGAPVIPALFLVFGHFRRGTNVKPEVDA